MLTFFYGNTGTGKSYAMMDRIKECAEAGMNICVIVPDQFTFEYERMLYDHLGCALFNNGCTEVWSFSRLTADIFRNTHAPEGDPAASTAKTAVMYNVIKQTAAEEGFAYFARQAKRPAFVNTALTMISELIHSGVTPEILGEIIKKAPENMTEKLTDIFLIYSRYSAKLESLSMRDALFDLKRASGYAGENNYFSGMAVFMDEFKSFTFDQYDMIKTILSDCAELTVCLTFDDREIKGADPFTAVRSTCGSLTHIAQRLHKPVKRILFSENKRYKSKPLFELSQSLMRLPTKNFPCNDESITLVNAPDIYGECSYICSEIRRLTSGDDTLRYSDITVLSRTMSEDISTLSAYFERYGIPYYSDKKKSAGNKPLMLMVNAALEIASAKNISTETLFRYAKTGLTEISAEEISLLENYCYIWDIDGKMWRETFPDEKCQEIKSRLLAPPLRLKKSCQDKTGREICAALRKFIGETGAEKKLIEFKGEYISQAQSLEIVRENERLCAELDEIFAELENVLDEKITLSSFMEIFTLSAAQLTLSSPPDSLDGVSAQQSDLARLTDPKIVFVMHANEGVFPFVTGQSKTFSESERRYFESIDHDLSGSMKKRMDEERFNAFKAVCAASERLYISVPAADIKGKKVYPSPIAEKIRSSALGARQINTSELDLLFFCRSKESAYAAAAERYDITDPNFATVKKELSEDSVYRKRFDYIDSIDAGAEHRIEDVPLMRKIYSDSLRLSASRFEDYHKCPFMYFCKTGLRIYPLNKKSLDPLNQGNIMHYCMKKVFEENGKDRFIGLSEDELADSIKKYSEDYLKENFEADFAKRKGFYFYLDMMKDTLLTALVHMQQELSVSDFTPSAFEYGVKINSDSGFSVKPVVLSAGEKLRVSFTGTADRVDTYTDKDGVEYIRILDYKTGNKDFMKEQLELGINMQMFFYLFALSGDKNGRFSGCVPAGVLYVPVKYPKFSELRFSGAAEREKCIDDALKMQGAVLEDMEIINAMENNCQGRFIPVSFKKDGGLTHSSTVLDSQSMDRIRQMAERQLEDMAANVYSGKIPASPLECRKLKCDLPCGYCDYKEICGNYPDPAVRDIGEIGEEMESAE